MFQPLRDRRELHAGITPSEVRAVAILLAAVIAYGAAMLGWSRVPLSHVGRVVGAYGPLTAFSVILVAATYAAICLLSRVARRDLAEKLMWLGGAGLMTCLTMPFYGLFKQIILPARGFLWDGSLAHIGRALFGVSPWVLTHRLFGTPAGTRVLDDAYSLWMILIFGFPLITALLFSDRTVRLRLLLAWFGGWVVIGTLAAWVFASAGPCYYNVLVGHDASYAELHLRLAEIGREAAAQGHPIAALQFQPLLLNAFRAGDYAPAGGISAMPSMHVAMATLLAIAGLRQGRWWGALFSGYALLIWTASIHFGWHYFVDGPVAALMMWGVWKSTAPLAALIAGREPSIARRLPAIAQRLRDVDPSHGLRSGEVGDRPRYLEDSVVASR